MPKTRTSRTTGKSGTTCAFCRGTGKDPFELLSKLSKCQVCGGRGEVEVGQPAIECVYCGGSGVHRDQRLTCTVCGGKGMATIDKGSQTCADCNGSGRVKGYYLPCLRCGGTGVVAKRTAVARRRAKTTAGSKK